MDNYGGISMEYGYCGGQSERFCGAHEAKDRRFFFCVAIGVLAGEYSVKIADEIVSIFPGQTIVIAEQITHDIRVKKECLLSFAHFFCRFASLDVFRHTKKPYILLPNDEVLKYIEEMNEKSEIPFLQKLDRDRAIAGIARTVLKKCGTGQREFFAETWLLKVLEYIHDHIHEQISSDDLIARSGYSKTVFYEKFTQSMKITPNKYILSKKMQSACEYLLRGCNVTETAEKVGFFDDLYFCKVFKKHVGIVPSAYKKYILSKT